MVYALLSLLLFALYSAPIDLAISSYFYPFHDTLFLDMIYYLGPVPAWVVVIGSLIGFFIPRYRSYRRIFLYLILTLALGSGLIVHEALKEHWGRPRPKQVEQFGGKESFQPFYKPQWEWGDPKHRSFASGHVTTGFFFFAFYFIGQTRRVRNFSLLFSFILGGLLTYARVAQGGHFLSDALGSMVVMYLTAYFLTPILYYERSHAKAS